MTAFIIWHLAIQDHTVTTLLLLDSQIQAHFLLIRLPELDTAPIASLYDLLKMLPS